MQYPMPGVPDCIAFVICGQIIEDKTTHNKSLIGLFNQVLVEGFPALYTGLAFYIALTNVDKPMLFRIALRAPDGKLLLEGNMNLETRGVFNPEDVHELAVKPPNIIFQSEGKHMLEVWVGDDLKLAERQINVILQTPA